MYPFIIVLTPFRNRKSPLSGKVYQLFLMSVSMFFSPLFGFRLPPQLNNHQKNPNKIAQILSKRLSPCRFISWVHTRAVCAVPFLSPSPCVSEYPRHRDYSCCSCQQRASFRLSLLHSMTSAQPSHLKSRRERPLPHTHSPRRIQTTPHQYPKTHANMWVKRSNFKLWKELRWCILRKNSSFLSAEVIG